MSNFCDICGAPLDESGLCPCCDGAEAPVTGEAEVVYEPVNEPGYKTIDVDPVEEAEARGQARCNANPQPVQYTPRKPSPVSLTFKQVWRVVRCFFSKNAPEAVTAQFNEGLPIWAVLLPLGSLLGGLGGALAFNSRDTRFETDLFAQAIYSSRGAAFMYGLLFSAAILFAVILGVMLYFKAYKQRAGFRSCANLTCCAFLPLMTVAAADIVTAGQAGAVLEPGSLVFTLACCAVFLLLYTGVTASLGKKPFWSFMLMLLCSLSAAVAVCLLIAVSAVASNAISSAANVFYSDVF